jgi:hypothetical protein
MKKVLVLFGILGVVAAANAQGISHSLDIVAHPTAPIVGGATSTAFHLKVQIGQGDDWTSTAMQAEILVNNKHWYKDALGSFVPPNPAFFPVFPSLQWDTFFTTPGGYPNPGAATPGFAEPPVPTISRNLVEAIWFDSVNTGGGNWAIAQLTLWSQDVRDRYVVGPLGAGGLGQLIARVTGTTTHAAGGGNLVPFSFGIYQIPEPATLSLLALGGLVGLIRRR